MRSAAGAGIFDDPELIREHGDGNAPRVHLCLLSPLHTALHRNTCDSEELVQAVPCVRDCGVGLKLGACSLEAAGHVVNDSVLLPDLLSRLAKANMGL